MHGKHLHTLGFEGVMGGRFDIAPLKLVVEGEIIEIQRSLYRIFYGSFIKPRYAIL